MENCGSGGTYCEWGGWGGACMGEKQCRRGQSGLEERAKTRPRKLKTNGVRHLKTLENLGKGEADGDNEIIT